MTAGDVIVVRESANSRQAVAFDGTDDYIQVNNAAIARVSANDTVGTFTSWVLINSLETGAQTIIGAGDDSVVEFLELNIEAGLITGRCTDGTVVQFVTQADAIEIKALTWHHISMVQSADGGGVKLYVDGLVIASTNDTSTDLDEWFNNLDGIDTMRIGAANKAGNASITNDFNGMISDTKYFSVALTASDILKDYKGETARPEVTAALQNHWDFNKDLGDDGLGDDGGTAVNDAYNCGWGSAWSRQVETESNGHAAERMNTVINGDIHTTVIVKGD